MSDDDGPTLRDRLSRSLGSAHRRVAHFVYRLASSPLRWRRCLSCAIHYDAATRNEELKQTFATTWSLGRRVTTCCPPTPRSFLFPILFVGPLVSDPSHGRRRACRKYKSAVGTRSVSPALRCCYETCRVSPPRHNTGVFCRSTGYIP